MLKSKHDGSADDNSVIDNTIENSEFDHKEAEKKLAVEQKAADKAREEAGEPKVEENLNPLDEYSKGGFKRSFTKAKETDYFYTADFEVMRKEDVDETTINADPKITVRMSEKMYDALKEGVSYKFDLAFDGVEGIGKKKEDTHIMGVKKASVLNS